MNNLPINLYPQGEKMDIHSFADVAVSKLYTMFFGLPFNVMLMVLGVMLIAKGLKGFKKQYM